MAIPAVAGCRSVQRRDAEPQRLAAPTRTRPIAPRSTSSHFFHLPSSSDAFLRARRAYVVDPRPPQPSVPTPRPTPQPTPQPDTTPPAPFRFVDEPALGEAIAEVFHEYWPAYRRWFLRAGERARPSYAECTRALRAHMPELVPTYERLCELVGGGDQEARMLSLWCPTPFMTGCSQAVWLGEPLALIRNYDYAPHLIDAVILRSAWHGGSTVAMTDCLWGALDGMNGDGLAVALAFGGRRVVGEGFAISLILRYLLETCATTDEATRALQRVPSHMTYSVSIVDAAGRHATVFVAPDRGTIVTEARVCTNHQTSIEWPEHATLTATEARLRLLVERLDDPSETFDHLVERFHEPPLFLKGRFRKWRTLYTSVYMPQRSMCEYRWPGSTWGTPVVEPRP